MSFWKNAGMKFIENLLSVKVWTIFFLMIITGVLTWYGKMTGEVFAAVNGGVISTVYALREGFKISKVHALSNGADKESKDEIKKVQV